MNADPQSAARDDKQQVSRKLIRIGMATYVCGLLLIGAFSVASQFIADSIIHRRLDAARVIRLSERQRVLSQVIARLALERTLHSPFRPDAQTQTALLQNLELMEHNHQELLLLSQASPAEGTSAVVRQVYLGAPWMLDTRIKQFFRHATLVANHPVASLSPANPDLRALEIAAQDPLLSALDAAVQANEMTTEAADEHLRSVLSVITRSMLLVLLLEGVFLYRPLFRRLARAHYDLLEAGRTDPLTGCLNRRAFAEEGRRILLETREHGGQISVMMIDIDRFKSINDRFGHATGDKVINAVVAMLVQNIEKHHILCRMGGEEFAVMLPGDSLEEAAETAEALRLAVASEAVPLEAPVKLNGETHTHIPITVSIGVADLRYSDSSLFRVLGRADKAVYRAKHNGRNRVEIEPSEFVSDANFIYPRRTRA